ncbi:MAG: hypothetical protein IJP01_06035 [Oscillospiraceae bacterium]|nr:hypothetical protein [Oscillospiraceae bacterium]
MNEKQFRTLRIAVKVLLCLSLIVFISLLLSYLRNLNPTADGFAVGGIIVQLIHGDSFWTWEALTRGLYGAGTALALLFCADAALALTAKEK